MYSRRKSSLARCAIAVSSERLGKFGGLDSHWVCLFGGCVRLSRRKRADGGAANRFGGLRPNKLTSALWARPARDRRPGQCNRDEKRRMIPLHAQYFVGASVGEVSNDSRYVFDAQSGGCGCFSALRYRFDGENGDTSPRNTRSSNVGKQSGRFRKVPPGAPNFALGRPIENVSAASAQGGGSARAIGPRGNGLMCDRRAIRGTGGRNKRRSIAFRVVDL